ncbi:MASE1 domain-containing protein [Mesorhizobium sp. C280B]|uniref:MASE1 domain-containing protein n=1 Tax=unclassified Mesorhizobium TaxID=325217 RepID=UPI0004CE970B|nr:MASE1 domain-containing protein [Mesorhizobium sp. LSJC280B00]
MSRVWSHRPQFLHLGLFITAYVLGCGFAQSLAIIPGTGISIWPPSGLFIATLVFASRYSWPWWVLGACVAELFSNFLWFHTPLPAAFLIFAGNALEAVAGAWLVNQTCKRPVRLETLRDVLAFVALAAGVAPVASATVGSAALSWFGIQSQTFATAWPLWWIGDATGVLIVAPLALVVFQNWRGKAQLSAARWMEACVLGLIFLGTAALSLSGYLPFAYIIMPPLLWAAVRFEFRGAAVALTVLALITAVFTISGASQFAGDPESQKHNQIMLQLFLAISAFSALVMAAISRQHQAAVLTLRQSVETLRERERELSLLVEMIPAHIARMAPNGEPTFFSKRTTDYIGLNDIADWDKPGTSRLATVVAAAVHPDDGPRMREWLSRSLATGEPYPIRYRLRRADGVYRWREGRAEPLRNQSGAIVQWYTASIDIDDEVRAQEALRDRERELSQLVDMVPSHVWRLTPDGEPTFFNKRMVDFLGLDVTDLDKQGISRLAAMIAAIVHPDDAAAFGDTLSHCLATGERFSMRYRLRRADGIYHWMSSRAEPMHDHAGLIAQWYGLCHDIDDQMQAEEALRRSELQLQQMIDAVPVRIWSAVPTGGPVYFNKRYQDHFRAVIANFETLGEPRIEELLQELVHPEDAPEVLRTLLSCFETGGGSAMRFRWRETDGYRWAECRVEPRRDEDGAVVQWYGVSLDIDEEVRAQEALRQASDKLAQATQAASLAELSASIAHEVNQPLAAIVANSHACHRWLSAAPPNVERAKITAERIIRDANSAADVVGRIRALFKQSTETRTNATLSSVIAEARDLVAEEAMRRGVRTSVDVGSDIPLVAFDRVQIQQVLVNLIRNGMEAMDSGADDGVISIRVRHIGDVVQTEVRDRGRGVAFPDRIFEPFFTTKEQGMGMGLAICRSIIESHSGRLWVEKNEPRGATFIFTLPIEAKAAS